MNENVIEDGETISVAPTKQTRPLSYYEEKRVRHGKTKRDHQSGAHKRRFDNNALRGAWINESRGKHIGFPPFPAHVCKGLGNSSKRYKEKPGKAIRG